MEGVDGGMKGCSVGVEGGRCGRRCTYVCNCN